MTIALTAAIIATALGVTALLWDGVTVGDVFSNRLRAIYASILASGVTLFILCGTVAFIRAIH